MVDGQSISRQPKPGIARSRAMGEHTAACVQRARHLMTDGLTAHCALVTAPPPLAFPRCTFTLPIPGFLCRVGPQSSSAITHDHPSCSSSSFLYLWCVDPQFSRPAVSHPLLSFLLPFFPSLPVSAHRSRALREPHPPLFPFCCVFCRPTDLIFLRVRQREGRHLRDEAYRGLAGLL